jgi:hypothetical protein
MKRLMMGGVVLTVLLGGCSSSPNEELYERIAELEEMRQEREQEYVERQQELREEEIDHKQTRQVCLASAFQSQRVLATV